MNTNNEPVTLINPFTVPKGKLDAAIEMWEKARDFLSEQPGYIATALHQSIADTARFRLINVAIWESESAFVAASQKMRAEAGLKPVEGVEGGPALYTVIRN